MLNKVQIIKNLNGKQIKDCNEKHWPGVKKYPGFIFQRFRTFSYQGPPLQSEDLTVFYWFLFFYIFLFFLIVTFNFSAISLSIDFKYFYRNIVIGKYILAHRFNLKIHFRSWIISLFHVFLIHDLSTNLL